MRGNSQADWSGIPREHGGEPFTFRLEFSESLAAGFSTIKKAIQGNHCGGSVTATTRKGSNSTGIRCKFLTYRGVAADGAHRTNRHRRPCSRTRDHQNDVDVPSRQRRNVACLLTLGPWTGIGRSTPWHPPIGSAGGGGGRTVTSLGRTGAVAQFGRHRLFPRPEWIHERDGSQTSTGAGKRCQILP